jgi:hypothetical protein
MTLRSSKQALAWAVLAAVAANSDAWATTCYTPQMCVCYGDQVVESMIGTVTQMVSGDGGDFGIVAVETSARRDGPPAPPGSEIQIEGLTSDDTRVIAFRSSGGWFDWASIAADGTFECFSAAARQRRVDATSALQIAVDPNCDDRARDELGLTEGTCLPVCAAPPGAVLPATAAAVVALILRHRRRATRTKKDR